MSSCWTQGMQNTDHIPLISEILDGEKRKKKYNCLFKKWQSQQSREYNGVTQCVC